MHLLVPLILWDAFVSVQLSSHPVGCICQCTIVISPCGMHLSVYYCPLTLWDAFVSVQLSSHPVGCICQCTIVLSPCGMHLSVYYCIHMVTPRVFSCGTQQQQQQQQQQHQASSQPLCCNRPGCRVCAGMDLFPTVAKRPDNAVVLTTSNNWSRYTGRQPVHVKHVPIDLRFGCHTTGKPTATQEERRRLCVTCLPDLPESLSYFHQLAFFLFCFVLRVLFWFFKGASRCFRRLLSV